MLKVLTKLSEKDGFEQAVNSVADAVRRDRDDIDSLLVLHDYLQPLAKNRLMKAMIFISALTQGLGTLWFSLFEKGDVRNIFNVGEDKDPVGIICVGYLSILEVPLFVRELEEKLNTLINDNFAMALLFIHSKRLLVTIPAAFLFC